MELREEILEQTRVLIVCDSPDRVNYLSHHLRSHHMKPIRYPNHGATSHALKKDSFGMVIVDLTLPVENRIELVKMACVHQKNARIIAIGKTLYLEKAGVLNDFPSVELLPDIKEFQGYWTQQG
jgi:DNA-binding NtrC family response regulator